MAFLSQWRAERDLQRKAAGYVTALFVEPEQADVEWLAQNATHGDVDHARWELRYARRSLGLIAAQRDALDDRTASIVAREITEAFSRDRNISAGMLETAHSQFNARLSAYRDGLASRAGAPTWIRMGQTLFAFAGGSFKIHDTNIVRAGELLSSYLMAANDALRASFGAAVLPENVPPSALTSGGSATRRLGD